MVERRILIVAAAFVLTTALGVRAAMPASTMPTRAPMSANNYVIDQAHMFGADAISQIVSRDVQLQKKTGTIVAVHTVASIPEQGLGSAAGRAAAAMHLNGVIIFVARNDRRFAIAYSPNVDELFSPARQSAIEQSLSVAFRTGHYDSGIVAAVSSIADVLAGGPSGGHGPIMTPTQQPRRPPSDEKDFGWVLWILLVIVGILFMLPLLRRR